MCQGIRWGARVLGLVLAGLVTAFLVGEGVPSWAALTTVERIQTLGMALMFIGALAGWRWPLAGGLALLSGWGIHQGVEVYVNGALSGGLFPVFILSGALYLMSAFTRQTAHN